MPYLWPNFKQFVKDGHWIFGQKYGHSRLWRQQSVSERICSRLFHQNWSTLLNVAEGPQLPMPMSGHCLVKVNQTTALFMYRNKTFFFDFPTQSWIDGPEMNYDRVSFGCGIMGNVVIAAGGRFTEMLNTTEFLSLDDPNDFKWSPGTSWSLITSMNYITACLEGAYVVNQRKRKKPYFATQLYQPSSNTYYFSTCDEKNIMFSIWC